MDFLPKLEPSLSVKQRNEEDVHLIFQTLKFLELVQPSTLKVTDFRSLIVNLCDMQTRFATPMDLPFGIADEQGYVQQDMKEPLPTPRPKDLLLTHKVIYKCPEECLVRWQTWIAFKKIVY